MASLVLYCQLLYCWGVVHSFVLLRAVHSLVPMPWGTENKTRLHSAPLGRGLDYKQEILESLLLHKTEDKHEVNSITCVQ